MLIANVKGYQPLERMQPIPIISAQAMLNRVLQVLDESTTIVAKWKKELLHCSTEIEPNIPIAEFETEFCQLS